MKKYEHLQKGRKIINLPNVFHLLQCIATPPVSSSWVIIIICTDINSAAGSWNSWTLDPIYFSNFEILDPRSRGRLLRVWFLVIIPEILYRDREMRPERTRRRRRSVWKEWEEEGKQILALKSIEGNSRVSPSIEVLKGINGAFFCILLPSGSDCNNHTLWIVQYKPPKSSQNNINSRKGECKENKQLQSTQAVNVAQHKNNLRWECSRECSQQRYSSSRSILHSRMQILQESEVHVGWVGHSLL